MSLLTLKILLHILMSGILLYKLALNIIYKNYNACVVLVRVSSYKFTYVCEYIKMHVCGFLN